MDNDELVGRLCAHRGYHNPLDDNDPNRFLENTRLAYVRGFELLDRAECDVQLSADGEVFLLHDSCLARVAAVTDLVVPGEEGESALRMGCEVEALRRVLALGEGGFGALELEEALKDPLYGALWERSLAGPGAAEGLEALFLSLVPVQLLTGAQLGRVPLKGGAEISSLEEVLGLLERSEFATKELVIEMKPGNADLVAPLVDLLDSKSCWDRVYLMSFDSALMKDFHKYWRESGARRAQDAVLRSFWLVCTYPCDDLDEEPASLLTSSDQVEELLGSLGRLGVGGVYLQYRSEVVTPALVRRLCEAGYGVGIWSGRPEHETPETVRAMVGAGVSLFNTDEPERLPELLRGSGGGSE